MSAVQFKIENDADATRIAAVLSALGYEPIREFEDKPNKVWTVAELARRHKLTSREQDILELVVAGLESNDAIANRLLISRATVKWHMHNIFAKTNTTGREGLLRAALGLTQLSDSVPQKSWF
jgi:ATP/maltotriose-dependent transcriptional regulator MalT